jgi:hypothetical protein
VPTELRQEPNGSSLRFFAPSVGDRWNATTTYWLRREASPALPMATRPVAPDSNLPLQHSALESGHWREPRIYDSRLAGPSGDHWFAAALRTGPGQPAAVWGTPLTSTLPLLDSAVALTLTGSSYTSGAHVLRVQLGQASTLLRWSGAGNWTHALTLTGNARELTLTLVPDITPDGVLLDSITWRRVAALDANGKGAIFEAASLPAQYQLMNVPAGAALYDITDARAPVLVQGAASPSFSFADSRGARRYLLAGLGTLHKPGVAPVVPTDLASGAADVVYIAPQAFHAALAPLIAHRRSQGYRAALLDVQAIYDGWSGGQVAPDAIRAFVRYAAHAWRPAPHSVVLVGDGTSDPHNYTGRNNVNVIPPYLAPVDPLLGETACETCYVQLDGDDPLDDALPDLALGRLPVKTPDELRALVAKLIGYETAPLAQDGGVWRARALYLADNYRETDGARDEGGDFALFSDEAAALQPPRVAVERVYYDPLAHTTGQPWREASAARARQRTLAAWGRGAALITYTGHSHHWQWATTDLASEPSYLLGLFDADELANGARLPVVLAMTCLTSAFQTPAHSGTTLDERLLLNPNGGAVAVWGSTGLGVARGHEALQRGFVRAHWAAPGGATLGALTLAGYRELASSTGGGHEALRTYALLGDPLTPLRMEAAHTTWLPLVRAR